MTIAMQAWILLGGFVVFLAVTVGISACGLSKLGDDDDDD
jgi:hypothetical protein